MEKQHVYKVNGYIPCAKEDPAEVEITATNVRSAAEAYRSRFMEHFKFLPSPPAWQGNWDYNVLNEKMGIGGHIFVKEVYGA